MTEDLLRRAQTAFRSRNFTQAKQILTQALTDAPADPILHLRLGQVHMAQGYIEDALSSLRTAQSLNPNDPAVYRSIVMAIRMTGNIDLGISYIGSMLGFTPLTLQPQVYLSLAELYAAQGNTEELRKILGFIAKLPPHDLRMELRLCAELGDASALFNFSQRELPIEIQALALGLALESQNPQEAIPHLQKAAQADLWEAFIGLYRITQQEQHLLRAAQLAPQTAEIGIYTAKAALPDPTAQSYLRDLSTSPVVFARVRQQAKKIIDNLGDF